MHYFGYIILVCRLSFVSELDNVFLMIIFLIIISMRSSEIVPICELVNMKRVLKYPMHGKNARIIVLPRSKIRRISL